MKGCTEWQSVSEIVATYIENFIQKAGKRYFHTRTMHLLHGVGSSAKMPVFGHFVCIIVAIHTE